MKFIRKCKLFYLYDMKMEYKLLLSHLTLSVLAILLLTTLLYTNSAGILERKLLNSAEALERETSRFVSSETRKVSALSKLLGLMASFR